MAADGGADSAGLSGLLAAPEPQFPLQLEGAGRGEGMYFSVRLKKVIDARLKSSHGAVAHRGMNQLLFFQPHLLPKPQS